MAEIYFNILAKQGLPSVIIVLIVLAIAAFIGVALYCSWKRTQALRQWAISNELMFHPGKDKHFDDTNAQFSCFRQGHSRYAKNVMSGHWDENEAIFFDYHYTTGSGKNQSHHSFSGVLVRSHLAMEMLRIRPEHIFDKVGDFFGLGDIDFESAEFSRKFHVKAKNRKWAYDVLHARSIEFLLARPRHTIEFQPGWVLVRKSGTFKPVAFEQAVHIGMQLLNMIPDYVKDDIER